MICKKCGIVMESGTEYNPKRDNRDKGYRRYSKCRKCCNKIYNSSPNFQEILGNESVKKTE